MGSRDRSHLGLSSHDDKGELRNETEVVVAVREAGPQFTSHRVSANKSAAAERKFVSVSLRCGGKLVK